MGKSLEIYWLIFLAILFVIALVLMWAKGKKDTVKSIVYMLVCQAEQQSGSVTGSIKWATVWANLYERLPWLIRLVFPKKTLEDYIEEAVTYLKSQLNTNKNLLLTYNEEQVKNTPVVCNTTISDKVLQQSLNDLAKKEQFII